MRSAIEKQKNLDLLQGEAVKLLTEKGRVTGIETKNGVKIFSDSVILTTGTFLNGLIHVGLTNYPGGRSGEPPAIGLSDSLRELGFEVKRLKTGTPPRVNSLSVDFSKAAPQPGDEPPIPFSHFTDTDSFRKTKKQLPCYLTYTNETTHEIIRKNLDRSPLYSGVIKSVGPRYCPSIEDKVVRFPERVRHQVFLEPEGFNTTELYVNGISTSLPEDVQENIVHSIEGLENAIIMRYGYAIEYDYCPPTQLKPTLETKNIENLYFAGQINGTTGYEEAAAQGFMAGVNAANKLFNKLPLVLERDRAYIGVMIDDLVTKGIDEPYRMFTSRAEYRLNLRFDNADLRLMDIGKEIGLISDKMHNQFVNYRSAVEAALTQKEAQSINPADISPWTVEQVNLEASIEKKYSGYITRQRSNAGKQKKMETKRIPAGLDFTLIPGLTAEAKQKFGRICPETIGQASRIPGITPADIALLLIHMEKTKKLKLETEGQHENKPS
jgi:tRNA uridine 5-carboxymethylaminomethyl modification enzyme